jgi:DNA-binding protein H-NS
MSLDLPENDMTTYRQLKQQIAELEKKAAIVRNEEATQAIEAIKQQIAEFGLTAADLGRVIATGRGAKTTKAKKLALTPKYRDPTTGKTWNGHGKRPGWIVTAQNKGKLGELLIAKSALVKASPQAKASVKPAAKKTQKKRTSAAKKPVTKKSAPSAKKPRTAAKPASPAATETTALTS